MIQKKNDLEKVSKLYDEMRILYENIGYELSQKSYPGLTAIFESLQQTMEEAEAIEDDLIRKAAQKETFDPAETKNKYRALKGAIKANKTTLKMAVNIKSMLHHELQQITQGRTVMNGYKQAHAEERRLVNNSC